MPVLFDDELHVHYGQFYVESRIDDFFEDLNESRAGQTNGLCGAAVPGFLYLTTGLHTGNVRLTVEASFRPADEQVLLVQWAGERTWPLALDGIDYRVRYCATGLDEGRRGDTRPSSCYGTTPACGSRPSGPTTAVMTVFRASTWLCPRCGRRLPTTRWPPAWRPCSMRWSRPAVSIRTSSPRRGVPSPPGERVEMEIEALPVGVGRNAVTTGEKRVGGRRLLLVQPGFPGVGQK